MVRRLQPRILGNEMTNRPTDWHERQQAYCRAAMALCDQPITDAMREAAKAHLDAVARGERVQDELPLGSAA